jgi:hypothetical protein
VQESVRRNITTTVNKQAEAIEQPMNEMWERRHPVTFEAADIKPEGPDSSRSKHTCLRRDRFHYGWCPWKRRSSCIENGNKSETVSLDLWSKSKISPDL